MRRYAVAPDHGRLSPDEPEASIGMSRKTHSMPGKTVLITGATGGIGRYFVTKTETRSSDVSYDERLARRLWEAIAELTNLPVQNR